MATLFLKRNTWYINYRVNGRRYRKSTGTSSRKLALVKLEDLKVKLFKGEMGAKASSRARTIIPEFFKRYVEYICSNSSTDKHSDLSRLRAFQNFFARKGIRHLDSITPSVVDDFRASVLAGKKAKTVRNYIMLLKTALNKAVEWDSLSSNPISVVKTPRIVETFHFYSRNEISRLIGEAEEPLKTAIVLLVNTGMRRGELFNLRWRDVDLKAKQLRVWPYDEFTPKGKRPRTIPLSDAAYKALEWLAKARENPEFVFRPYQDSNTLYRYFSVLARKLRIKGTLHDLRHSFASHLAMAGTPIPVIKELLGHSDISTTMVYAHLSPDIHRSEIRKLAF